MDLDEIIKSALDMRQLHHWSWEEIARQFKERTPVEQEGAMAYALESAKAEELRRHNHNELNRPDGTTDEDWIDLVAGTVEATQFEPTIVDGTLIFDEPLSPAGAGVPEEPLNAPAV